MITIKSALGLLTVDGRFVLGMMHQSRNKNSCSCNC
jgi:hypothetical protein